LEECLSKWFVETMTWSSSKILCTFNAGGLVTTIKKKIDVALLLSWT
jgi:hypothetical protein